MERQDDLGNVFLNAPCIYMANVRNNAGEENDVLAGMMYNDTHRL